MTHTAASVEMQNAATETIEGDRCLLQPRSIAVYVSIGEPPVRKKVQREKTAGKATGGNTGSRKTLTGKAGV